jgi:hypothetical protein
MNRSSQNYPFNAYATWNRRTDRGSGIAALDRPSRQFSQLDEQVMRPHEPGCGEGSLGVQLR